MFDYSKKDGVIWLYDEIAPDGYGGISAGDVRGAMKSIGRKDITVRINSPGGHVAEGVAIFNMLDRHKKAVTTINDGVAASIANYVFMAGDNRLAAGNSMSMVHSPWSIAMGNADDMRAMADVLDKAKESLSEVYSAKMEIGSDAISAIMEAETWYTAKEAVSAKMATDVGTDLADIEPIKIAASRYQNTPAALRVDLAAGSRSKFFTKRRQAEQLVLRTKAKYHIKDNKDGQ